MTDEKMTDTQCKKPNVLMDAVAGTKLVCVTGNTDPSVQDRRL